jgi:hypothetical protein
VVACSGARQVARVLRAASWWDVLDVEAGASAEAVRRAHRAVSLQTHPDKVACQAGAHDATVRVNNVRPFFPLRTQKRSIPNFPYVRGHDGTVRINNVR